MEATGKGACLEEAVNHGDVPAHRGRREEFLESPTLRLAGCRRPRCRGAVRRGGEKRGFHKRHIRGCYGHAVSQKRVREGLASRPGGRAAPLLENLPHRHAFRGVRVAREVVQEHLAPRTVRVRHCAKKTNRSVGSWKKRVACLKKKISACSPTAPTPTAAHLHPTGPTPPRRSRPAALPTCQVRNANSALFRIRIACRF